jgi:hypothetical protein
MSWLLRNLTSTARALGELPSAARARRRIMRGEAAAEQKFVEVQAVVGRAKSLSPSLLNQVVRPKLAADTFFILGSGASIEELTPQHFEEIGRQRSVGINNWPVHPFVPDFYSFESVPGVGDGQDFPRALQMLSREDIVRAKPGILVLRPKTKPEIDNLRLVPEALKDNIMFHGRITPATRRPSNLVQDLRGFFGTVAMSHPSVMIDSGASVVRMASLAISLGFRNIVFAGVDLTNSQYFWEKNPAYLKGLKSSPPVNNQKTASHETLSKNTRPFSVIDMVRGLSEYLTNDMGGKVLVTSKESALAEFLDVYRWEG